MTKIEFDWIENDMNRMNVWPNERMNERTSEQTERNETNRIRTK